MTRKLAVLLASLTVLVAAPAAQALVVPTMVDIGPGGTPCNYYKEINPTLFVWVPCN
jgi:hypothetical protein